MLYVYLFHDTVSCLYFSQYTILLSGTLYEGTSNCFMSTYFIDMLLVYLITVYYFTLMYIMPRNVELLYALFLFHGHASCLPFSQYTSLYSGTLYLGTSNCLMSTYFMDMHLVYIFHGMLFTFWYITCRNV